MSTADDPGSSLVTPEVTDWDENDQEVAKVTAANGGNPYPDFEDISLPLNEESVLPPQEKDPAEQQQEEDEGSQSPQGSRLNASPAMMMTQQDRRAAPPAAAATASEGSFGGHRGGFNLRNYEEETTKLKNENLKLKLRIYFLEERFGFGGQPKPVEDKENVYK